MNEKAKVPRFHPLLRAGQLVRLVAGGPIHTVVRTTVGAAYVARGDWLDDSGHVLVRPWNDLDAVSLHAAVFPE